MQKNPDLMAKSHLAELTGDDLLLLDIPGYKKKERWNNFFKTLQGRSCWIFAELGGSRVAYSSGVGNSADIGSKVPEADN